MLTDSFGAPPTPDFVFGLGGESASGAADAQGVSSHRIDRADGSVLLLPGAADIRRAVRPEQISERLRKAIDEARRGDSNTRISLATAPPIQSRMADAARCARYVRKLAFDEGLGLVDLHDELTSGRNPLARFTRDGFLFRTMPINPPKGLRNVVDGSAWPSVESSGQAVRYGEFEAAVRTNKVPELMGPWTSIAGGIDTNNGVFAVTLDTNRGHLVTHPVSLDDAGPGRLTVGLRVSRDVAVHDLPVCFLQDKDGFAFQLPPTEAERKAGRWELSYDLTAGSVDCRAVGHGAAWCETYRRRCSKVGFSVFRNTEEAITFTFESVEYEARQWEPKPIRILDFRAPSHEIPAYATFEPRFHVDGLPPGNQFDPEVVRVICEVDTPSGTTNRVNGFLHQDFVRELVAGSETLTAVGPLEWRVRYTPTEPGKHWYRIGVKVPGMEIWSAKYAMTCTPAEHPGFVRVAKKAGHCFETEDGAFFHPLGLNLHNPYDSRNETAFGAAYKVAGNPGTFIYERIMERLAAVGGNAATVWLSPWWLEFEWNAAYPDCHGLTDYNLKRAWQLDQVMAYARANGIRINLSLENHGKFSAYADAQWDENPYNMKNGGPVFQPDQFFTSLEARDIYRKKLDYLLARWGHDPHIMSFELASEADFFGSKNGFGRGPQVRNWHVATADYIRQNHPYPHLVSCHHALDMTRVDKDLAAHPAMDFYGVDAYSRRVDSSYPVLLANERNRVAPGKPYVTWEFGGSPRGASKVQLKADLHFGLWSSLFFETAGAPFMWWYEFVDRENLYPDIKSFQAFAKDVDKRRPSEKVDLVAEQDENVKGFARVYSPYTPGRGQGPLAEGWVYSESAIHAKLNWVPVAKLKKGDFPALPVAPVKQDPVIESEETKGARLRIPGTFPPGVSVEFWDTRKGEVIGGSSLLAGRDGVLLELPAFFDSIAFRIVGP